ncbi:MAG TPA: pyridoxal-dependent decarboxylase, exosortase A system-associated [Plasticicumulans sp.]|uniref:pyridoxal-dependent decarboxylase, exosortase A system-associated n=1 Tax=Plasticicumulans sp. TaxID=2307179 RepID=UPI002C21A5F6|nr:pyridoxal-dependent decarboxylase, exosortase A system-associated [Plasticicumulans sp.]MBS0599848.1 pyridoxal-dependent decarboxylase, exosortase A system-associated [Pseudomonadota bacterium]HMW30655.1 pyridoxal-dependent decarboxylase, exosortase A system-associated [Plasticicumulans sp.]HMW42710.1 pyridoxal-dependent decarboxylase, exosortase A system-associated [Plasticicumulans sp.]HMX53879.1 pyridoxal-dependent decarboxylase, exosortase A system-associated [Plasticicumulans sp.]HMZ10
MNAPRPVHAPMTQFPVVDGCLSIGGVPLPVLAARVGRTPFYAYDRVLIAARVAELRAALPAGIELHYAMKANPMPAVVQLLAGLVDGLDVASAGELQVALDTGIDAREISFAGPGKRDAELRAAIAAGITINLESFGETERVARIGDELGLHPSVAVRVNPDFELKAAGMKMGGGAKPFGVDAELVPELLARIGSLDLRFRGFHLFWGSQSLRAETIVDAHRQTFALGLRLADAAPAPVELFNIGGGFGIPYFPGETRLDLAPIADNLETLLPQLAARQPQARPVIELGRYLVGEAGIYVCEVLDRKVSRGQVYLVTDGGLHHHLAASGNFGQVIRKNYPVAIGTRMDSPATEIASVVGPLCTPLDLLGERMALAAAEPGDLVVVFQSGAYGRSASPAGFLSHPACAEVLV